jgi:hypothetical protein
LEEKEKQRKRFLKDWPSFTEINEKYLEENEKQRKRFLND